MLHSAPIGITIEALLFYSNFGYRAVDWTYAYEKNLQRSVKEQ